MEGKEAGEVEVGAEEGKVGGEGVRGGMEDGGLLIGPAAGSKWEERERERRSKVAIPVYRRRHRNGRRGGGGGALVGSPEL